MAIKSFRRCRSPRAPRASYAASSRRLLSGKENYVVAIGDVLKQYMLANCVLSSLPARQASDMFGIPGASPVVSSNGAPNDTVCALDTTHNGTNSSATSAAAGRFPYDAANLNKLSST